MTRRVIALAILLLTALGGSPVAPVAALDVPDPRLAPGTAAESAVLTQSDNVEVVARITEASTAIALAFDDDVLYVSTITGIFSYDISDPADPQLLGVLPEYIWQNEDMAIDTDRKLLFISRDPRGFTGIVAPPDLRFFGAVEIIDISNPRLMHHLNVIPLPAGHTSTCIAATDEGGCDFLWTGGPYASELFGPYGRPIYATDIRDPLNPVQCPEPINTGLYDGPDGSLVDGYAHDVQVDHRGVAWVSSEGGVHGYWTFGERHDPTTGDTREATPCDPVPYGGAGTPSEATPSRFMHNSALNPAITVPDDPDSAGHVLFATEEALSSNCATSGRFAAYDVRSTLDGSGFTDPAGTRMEVLDTWTPEGAEGATGCASAHYFDDRGDGVLAYSFYAQGTRFLDASDPTDIRQIGWYRPDGSNSYAAYHYRDLWWVADQGSGVHVLRFDGTPTRPQPAAEDGAAIAALPSPTVEAPPLTLVAQHRWEAANRADPATGMVCLLSPF
jgi:hypothetical protein